MSRTPDYFLKVIVKSSDKKGKVGAAWKEADGSISIVLNPCVHLIAGEAVIKLFPNDGKPEQ